MSLEAFRNTAKIVRSSIRVFYDPGGICKKGCHQHNYETMISLGWISNKASSTKLDRAHDRGRPDSIISLIEQPSTQKSPYTNGNSTTARFYQAMLHLTNENRIHKISFSIFKILLSVSVLSKDLASS